MKNERKVLKTFKCDPDVWNQLEKKAEDLSRKYGLHISITDLIREGIKTILEGDKNE